MTGYHEAGVTMELGRSTIADAPPVVAIPRRERSVTGSATASAHSLGGSLAARRRLNDRDGLELRAHLVDAVGEAVVAIGPDGRVVYVNPPAEELYACSAGDALGRPASDVLGWGLPDDVVARMVTCDHDAVTWTGDLTLRDGATACITVAPVRIAGEVVAMVASAADTTERDLAQAALLHQSLHDEVTGLPNRRGLVARIDGALERHDFGASSIGIIRLDIHDLRTVSDSFGQMAASRVMETVSRSIAGAAHTGDVVARISGASFGILCPHVRRSSTATQLADRLRAVARQPVAVGANSVTLGASAGIASSTEGTEGAEELLQRANIALSHARELGRDESWMYDDEFRLQLLRQLELEALIRRAIALGEVTLGYQPIVRLHDQAIMGAEALLRMQDDQGEAISAFELVTVAERAGLIGDLGRLVLRTACREAARWQRQHPERFLSVSVNVSATQLNDARLPDDVEAVLKTTGLDAGRLNLEMTETVLMADSTWSIRQLARLKMSGVRLSADDFGTGYSSLAYLKRFPLDTIKADISFVAGLPDSPEDVAVVSAIAAMADALGLSVVAEGVENLRQLGELERLGCGYGQGYLWSRAVPGDELMELLDAAESETELVVSQPGRGRTLALADEEGVDVALRAFAHEVRNPLSVVTGWAAMLETDDPRSVDAPAAGGHIRRAGERIERLLVDLDDIVALEEGRVVLRASAVELWQLVGDLIEDLGPRLGVSVALDRSGASPVNVHVDVARIEQVIVNLVSNAAKFSPPAGEIEVLVGRHDGWAEVTVLDEGPGIPEADIALAFRKYGRLDRRQPGSGMGLYLARGIARAHGGEVIYQRRSAAGGARFDLRLPAEGAASGLPVLLPPAA